MLHLTYLMRVALQAGCRKITQHATVTKVETAPEALLQRMWPGSRVGDNCRTC